MNNYFEMKFRKTGETVRVYNVCVDAGVSYATIYSPNLAGKQGGNGWQTVKMGTLVPLDFWTDDGFCSKTKKNKIKSRLKLITAEWQCTDGTVFTHEYLDDAIAYEAKLMGEEYEKENNEC